MILIYKKIFILIFNILELFFSITLFYILLRPLYLSSEVIISYGLTPVDICKSDNNLWNFLKQIYIFFFIFSNIMINNFMLNRFILKIFFRNNKVSTKKIISHNNDFQLLIGKSKINNIYIPENGLYQNFLITGTIGSRKDIICNVSIHKTVFRI